MDESKYLIEQIPPTQSKETNASIKNPIEEKSFFQKVLGFIGFWIENFPSYS